MFLLEMQRVLNQARGFAQQRSDYNLLYEKKEQNKKLQKASEKEILASEIYKGVPKTREQLLNIKVGLAQEYQEAKDIEVNYGGMPIMLSELEEKVEVKEFTLAGHSRKYLESLSYKDQLLTVYKDVVSIIQKEGWSIYSVNHNFDEKIKVDEFCSKPSFLFDVGYNDYRFQITVTLGFYPNVSITEITNIKTNETINVYCDLYSKSKVEYNILKKLLTSDYKTWIQDYTKYFKLPQLLAERGFTVESALPRELETDFSKKNFHIKLSNTKGSCVLLLIEGEEDYDLYVYKSLDQKSKNDSKRKFCCVPKVGWNLEYDSLEKLVENINLYIEFSLGHYGYYKESEKIFQNDQSFIKTFKNLNDKARVDIEYYDQSGHDFDIKVVHAGCKDYIPNTRNRLIDIVYPRDIYTIHFWYDRECHLTIDSKWFDITVRANRYYENSKEFVEPEFVKGESLNMQGNYEDCVRVVSELFDILK